MLAYLLSPNFQVLDRNGKPLTGGHLEVKIHDFAIDGDQGVTSANYITHSDFNGNLNPYKIPLDVRGMARVIADAANAYDVYCFDSYNNAVWSRLNVKCVNVSTINYEGDKAQVASGEGISVTAHSSAEGVTTYVVSASEDLLERIESIAEDELELSKDVEEIRDDVADLQKEYDKLERRVSTNEDDIALLDERLPKMRSEVLAGANVTVDERIADDGHSIYTVNAEGGGSGDKVNVTSADNSVAVSTSYVSGVKTFDLSVSSKSADWIEASGTVASIISHTGIPVPLTKTAGTIDVASGKIVGLGGRYHVSCEIACNTTASHANHLQIEVFADGQIVHTAYCLCDGGEQHFYFSLDLNSANNIALQYRTGEVSGAFVAKVWLHKIVGVGGGGSGDNDKVAINATATAGYLSDVLVSDCDEISLTPIGNQLRIGVNLTGESDPKLSTMPEAMVNSATLNYGAYAPKGSLVWGDRAWASYDWLNAIVYQCMRLSEAQGTITKCNVAVCGSIASVSPPACLNVGVFALDGTLLGSTGLKYYGTDFQSGTELCSFDMIEASVGALSLKRNTRYIVQVWSIGLQLAAHDRGDSYNYTYDFGLHQNMMTTVTAPDWADTQSDLSPTQTFPFISFGAADLS